MYHGGDPDAITAYPRQRTASLSETPRYRQPVPIQAARQANTLGRTHYLSDPSLLDDIREDSYRGGQYSTESGRRSAMSVEDYSRSEESENLERQVRKAKKKKMKHLRSFMHVFIGGLGRRKEDEEKGGIVSTRDKQRDERNGLAKAVAGGSSPVRGGVVEATSGDGSRRRNSLQGTPSPRHAASQRPPPALELPPQRQQHLKGLYNHGNTCFMNAVLQCLCNTDQLAEYFVTDAYKGDFNKNNATTKPAGHLGTSTNVTEQFALLLKCLWSGQYNPVVSSRFKEIVGQSNEQYQGSAQHDAQEFFLWLLDNIHEDLNQAATRRYKPLKDTVGRPDEEVAAEVLASHMQRNNSFIQNLFQGQFRSALICPSCSTRSCTFDPYVSISLPLPQQETKPVYVTVVCRGAVRKMKVYGVNVAIDSSIKELRNKLAELCGIHGNHLVLADLYPDGFRRTFYDDQHISVLHSNDPVLAFECPPYRGDNPQALTQSNPSGSKELILILVVNKSGQNHFGQCFGQPLILRVWRDLTHQQFQSVVLKSMARLLRPGVRLPEVCRSSSLFRCRVMDGLPGNCVLPTTAEHPFYSASVDKALHVSMLYGGPAHIKLVCEWEPETRARVFGVIPDLATEHHESVAELRQYYDHPLQTTLQESLGIYTREETLNREDSWFCPHCRQQQQDATKKITLWTLPDVLVVHLKRFRQVGFSRMKLGTLVNFPITGLDMTPFLAPRSGGTHSRPSSATPLSRTQRSSTKCVHFEDEVDEDQKSPLGRSMSVGRGRGKWFLFPWKRQQSDKKAKHRESGKHGGSGPNINAKKSSRSRDGGRNRSRSPDPSRRSNSPPPPHAGSESPMSVRSAPSTINRSQLQPHHRYFLPPSPIHQLNNAAILDESRLNNVYDLFAVCNHVGTLSHGHYTAFCKNPADGRWYNYDDSTVQPIGEDQLVTPAAYMLFYVRQSLLSSSPLSSSESSQSSCNSGVNHWLNHMPPFRLDLNDYHDELCKLQQQQAAQQQQMNQQHLSQQTNDNFSGVADPMKVPRSRLNSSNSVFSTPANIGARVSPGREFASDVDDFASQVGSSSIPHNHHHPRSDSYSAVSLPPYHPGHAHHTPATTPSYNHTPSYSNRTGPGTRHQSLRLGRGRDGGWAGEERGDYRTQRSHEDLSSQTSGFEAYNGQPPRNMQGYVALSRSIPSLPTHDEIIHTPNKHSHRPPPSYTYYGHQTSAVSNGHIPVDLGSHLKSPSLTTRNHPESCV